MFYEGRSKENGKHMSQNLYWQQLEENGLGTNLDALGSVNHSEQLASELVKGTAAS